MRFAPQGIPKITEWKKRIGNIPLVAIGGIKFEQAAEIFAAGADSIAVVSDVTQNADPDARVDNGSARARRPHEMITTSRRHCEERKRRHHPSAMDARPHRLALRKSLAMTEQRDRSRSKSTEDTP